MKRVLILLFMLASFGASAQYGGEIRAKGYAPDDTLKTIFRKDRALRTYDTLTLAQIVLLRDTTSWKKSIKISEMPAITATVSGTVTATVDSNTQRIGIKVLQLPTVILDSSYTRNSVKLNGTLPSFGSTPTFNIGTIGTIATESTLSTLNGKIPSNLTVTSTRLLVDGSGVTQPVSGTFWQATQPVSLASVPSHAVTNAGTFAVQVDSSTQRSTIKISSMPSVTVDSTTSSRTTVKIITNVPIDSTTTRNTVKVLNTVPVSGTFYQATQPVSLASVPSHAVTLDSSTQRVSHKISQLPSLPSGSNSIGILGANSGVDIGDVTINNASGASAVNIQDGGNSITIDASSLPLPTGAATESTLAPMKTSLDLIDDGIGTNGGATPNRGMTVLGWDGTNGRILSTNTSGHIRPDSAYERSTIKISSMPSVTVDSTTASRITHKISESALPSGAATETTVSNIKTRMDSLLVYKRIDSSHSADILDWTSSYLPTIDNSVQNVGMTLTNGTQFTQIRDSTGDKLQIAASGEMYVQASQGGAWSVTASVDSSLQRVTHKISQMPTVSIDSSTTRNTVKVLNTVATSLDSSTQRSTIKISSMPSVSVDSTTGSRITQKISELVPLVAGTAYIGKTRLTDGTTDAEVVPLAGYNAGAVAIVDGSGNQITSFGGGTQYAEGNTTDPATGTVALGRYDATDLALTDEQLSAPLLTSRGELRSMQKNGAVVSDVLTILNDFVTIPCDGYNSIILDKLGTFNMTITPQWSVDGVTYTSNTANYAFTQTTAAQTKLQTLTVSTTGQYTMNTFGAKSVRLLVTAYTSGTCSITAAPTNYVSDVMVNSASSGAPIATFTTITSLSSGSGFFWAAEDGAAANTGVVTKTGLVRQDAPTSSTSTNLDYIDAKATKFGSMLVKDEERHFRTYTAAFTVTPAASCTDLFEIKAISKTVKINKITVTGTQTTGSTNTFYVIKRSTVNSGGTSSAATFVPHLTGDAAASSVGSIYTANPTLGTAVGNVGVKHLYVGTTTERADELVFDFGAKGKPIYLETTTSQALVLNLNSATFSGGSFAITIEITEED